MDQENKEPVKTDLDTSNLSNHAAHSPRGRRHDNCVTILQLTILQQRYMGCLTDGEMQTNMGTNFNMKIIFTGNRGSHYEDKTALKSS